MKQILGRVFGGRVGLFCIVLISTVSFCSAAWGLQRIEISSWNPVGSGARALGMGGAFIAIADDATAASWNPGGLIQLELPEISIVGNYFYRIEDNSFGTQPESSGKQDFDFTGLNYLSAAYPFQAWGRNMVVSLNYQNLYDFTREWHFRENITSGTLNINQTVNYVSEGDVGAVGLAYSVQVSPRLSFGLTLNFWNDGLINNTWENRTTTAGSGSSAGGPVTSNSNRLDKYSFDGFNGNFGFLWQVTGQLTIGGVFKSPFRADVNHEYQSSTYLQVGALPPVISNTSAVEELKIDMPMSYGLGAAYRFSDNFSMSLDIYQTRWDDFVMRTPTGQELSPINGEPISTADLQATTQVRAGAEYLFIKDRYVIPLRGGVFMDPAPAKSSPDEFYGLSVGSGIVYGRYIFDIAYQYRFANNVSEYILESLKFSQDVQEHTIYASMIIHF